MAVSFERFAMRNFGSLVKNRNFYLFVIPALAGIQQFQLVLDAGASPA